MTKRRIRKYAAGLMIGLLAWLPSLTYAIGLGQLKVHSALDEPLNGEIPFTSLNSAERRKLDVRLASRSDFAAAGIDRARSLGSLKFSVAKRVDGRYFLHVRTDEPFREPFLHVLIHLQWAGGRLIREYTALIDPPYLAAGKPSSVEVPTIAAIPEPEPVQKTVVPEPVPAPIEKQVAMAEQPEPVSVPEARQTAEPPVDKGAKAEIAAEAAPEPLPFEPGPEPLPDVDAGQTGQKESDQTRVADKSGDLGPGKESPDLKMTPSGWPEDEIAPDQPIVEELVADDLGKPAENDLLLEPDLDPEAGQSDFVAGGDDLIGPSGAGEYLVGDYKVVRGDTLWRIAEQARPDESISIEQVAMAIFRNNQRAFFDDNVNNLKAGKILTIPESEQIAETGHAAARKEFLTQYSVWQEYKLRMASADNTLQMDEGTGVQMESMELKEAAGSAGSEDASAILGDAATPITEESEAATKAVAAAEDKKSPEIVASTKTDSKTDSKTKAQTKEASDITPMTSEGMPAEDLLKIVRSKQDKEKSQQDKAVPDSESRSQKIDNEKAALADKVATLEESLTSADLANEEAGKRAGSVSEQLDTQKRLIELENQNLAQGQPADTTVKPESESGSTSTTAAKQIKPVKPPVPAPPQQSFLDQMMETVSGIITGSSSLLPMIGGAIVLIAGAVGIMVLRRRSQANIEFEESILNSQVDSEGTLSMDSGDESESGDTSFLSDFSQGGMGNVSTDEVDPIAEAEVYLAYGRDEQAEEILKDAIIKEPVRHELREKILEIYSQRNDASAFETVAEELYAALEGRGGELWDRVAAMGAKLNPDNPMFGGEGAGIATGDTVPPGGIDTGEITNVGLDDSGTFDLPTEMAQGDAAFDPSTDQTIQADAMDFSMEGSLDIGTDDSAIPQEESPVADDSDAIDFSLTMGDEADTAPTDDSGLDFSMDDTSAESGAEPSDDSGGLDFSASDTAVDMGDDGGLDFNMDDTASTAGEAVDDENIQWDVDTADGTGDSEVSSDDSGLAFETDTADSEVALADGGGEQEQWDETATKLDLARAYIDMGDAEGARSILDEVLAEGNEDQKKQAADLASQIA